MIVKDHKMWIKILSCATMFWSFSFCFLAGTSRISWNTRCCRKTRKPWRLRTSCKCASTFVRPETRRSEFETFDSFVFLLSGRCRPQGRQGRESESILVVFYDLNVLETLTWRIKSYHETALMWQIVPTWFTIHSIRLCWSKIIKHLSVNTGFHKTKTEPVSVQKVMEESK